MEPLETLVLIGLLVLLGAWLGPLIRVPVPLLQLLLGLAVGFVPAVRDIHLPADAVLVLFLPALLFWESLTTSLREIRRDLRGILILGTLLVVASAFGVAGIGVALGLTFGAAIILGAALAPTDATAVSAMAGSLPQRNMTVLRAESLINDGTALVVYTVAVGVVASHIDYAAWQVTGLVAIAYLGGAAIGLAVGWLGTVLLRHLRDSLVINLTLVVVPFTTFLLADLVTASGVIAVVVAGLVISQTGPRASTPQSRQQTTAFWSLTTTVLNGALFVLIGIEAQTEARAVPLEEIPGLIALTVLAWVAVLVIRFVFQTATVYLIRLLDRRPSQRGRRMNNRARVVSTVAGFRGAVSLAVALSVPVDLDGRAEIVFVAAGVVLLTLIVQGLTLPAVTRWAKFPTDTTLDTELAAARRAAATEVVQDGPRLAAELNVSDANRDAVLHDYQRRFEALTVDEEADDTSTAKRDEEQQTRLQLALNDRTRDVVVRLRDAGTISDSTLRALHVRLDRDTLRLSQPELLE